MIQTRETTTMHVAIGKVSPSLGSAAVLGALSTVGDWLWASFIPDGAVIPGVVHGLVIFLILAAVLAWAAGTRRAAVRLVPTLPVTGSLIAASFYPLAYLLGYVEALLLSWILMWLTLAVLQRWARERSESVARALVRGTTAALTSGVAFWSISGIWTNPTEPNYPLRFVFWTFAFLPGFLALLLGQPTKSASDSLFHS